MTIKTEDLLDDAARVVAADLYPERCRTVIANLAAELITARAKIEAAERLAEAVAPIGAFAVSRSVDAKEWRDKDTVSVWLSIGELRAAKETLAAWESLK